MCQRWPCDLLVHHFQIGEGGLAARAPVHHVLAAIDEALFVEADEDFAHGAREPGVEREALAAPVAACAQAHHLALDGVAVLRLPLPDALFEFLAARSGGGRCPLRRACAPPPSAWRCRRDRCPGSQSVLSPRMRCQRTVTSISVCSSMWPMWSEPVTLGGGMTSENTRAGALGGGVEDAGVDPPLRPMRLEPLWLIDFLNLHGEISS